MRRHPPVNWRATIIVPPGLAMPRPAFAVSVPFNPFALLMPIPRAK
jgi:hypothetical protein